MEQGGEISKRKGGMNPFLWCPERPTDRTSFNGSQDMKDGTRGVMLLGSPEGRRKVSEQVYLVQDCKKDRKYTICSGNSSCSKLWKDKAWGARKFRQKEMKPRRENHPLNFECSLNTRDGLAFLSPSVRAAVMTLFTAELRAREQQKEGEVPAGFFPQLHLSGKWN